MNLLKNGLKKFKISTLKKKLPQNLRQFLFSVQIYITWYVNIFQPIWQFRRVCHINVRLIFYHRKI